MATIGAPLTRFMEGIRREIRALKMWGAIHGLKPMDTIGARLTRVRSGAEQGRLNKLPALTEQLRQLPLTRR